MKTDARAVVSTYQYDELNRNTIVDYSDTTTINPDVKRFYDGATNGKGRFWYNYRGGDEYQSHRPRPSLWKWLDAAPTRVRNSRQARIRIILKRPNARGTE